MTGSDVGFAKPNTTQIPDEFWRLLPEMGEAEVKVMLYLLRQTFGFRREWTPQEYATNAAIARNTGLSEEGVRRGVAAGMKACRIDRQIGPDKRGWIYRVIIRTATDPELQAFTEPATYSVTRSYPNEVDPQPSVPNSPNEVGLSPIYPNEVDPLNTKTLKPSFTNVQDDCAAQAPTLPARKPGRPRTTPKPKAPADPRVAEMVNALAVWQGYPVTAWAEETIGAKKLIALGHDLAVVEKVWRLLKAEDFWQFKHLGLQSLAKQIGAKIGKVRRGPLKVRTDAR